MPLRRGRRAKHEDHHPVTRWFRDPSGGSASRLSVTAYPRMRKSPSLSAEAESPTVGFCSRQQHIARPTVEAAPGRGSPRRPGECELHNARRLTSCSVRNRSCGTREWATQDPAHVMEAGDACHHTCPTSSSHMRTRPAPACAGAGMACSDVDEQPWGRFVRSDDADAGPNAPRLGTGPAEGPPPTTRIGVSSMAPPLSRHELRTRAARAARDRIVAGWP